MLKKIRLRTSWLSDLMATAFSGHSRNRQVGINIAKGVSAEKTIEQMNMNAEGVSHQNHFMN